MDKMTNSFSERYSQAKGSLPGNDLTWLNTYRDAGIERFALQGLPTKKWEAWKYTNLSEISSTAFRSVESKDSDKSISSVPILFQTEELEAKLVFVNGFLRADLSDIGELPKGLEIQSLQEALTENPEIFENNLTDNYSKNISPFVALNSAFMESGVVIRVSSTGKKLKPIELVHLNGMANQPIIRHPRNLIIVEPKAEITIVKHHSGQEVGAYFTNAVTDINIGDDAALKYYSVQSESHDATHLSTINVRVGMNGSYESFSLAAGGRLSRHETNVGLYDEGASCAISGAYMMRGREHCDNTTVIDHFAPNTKSREVFKGVLDDEASGVFQGRIIVHNAAQGTDGYQLSKSLLLSDNAVMNAKPELEIYADDVKCSHGATTGQLDETSLFYLRSRGVPEALARNMLIQSFLGEALDEISNVALREKMLDYIIHRLPAHCFLSEEWIKP